MNPGDMIVLSDYWKQELVLVLDVDQKRDRCRVLFPDGKRDTFVLSFVKSRRIIQHEPR